MKRKAFSVFLTGVFIFCTFGSFLTPVQAEEGGLSLGERIAAVAEEYGMDDSDYAVVYYDTVTGESFDFNGGQWMIAASTYKLPLNLYYYVQELNGAMDPHAVVGGYDLANAHYLSLVYSDNDASEAMMNALGSFSTYKNLMFQTFGDAYYSDLNNISYLAYTDNYYTAGFMMDVLQYLNNNRSSFPEMLSYMSSIDQRNGFDNHVLAYCTVYQKQGWIDYINAVTEIVDSGEPYLAVVMVDFAGDHASAASALNDAVYAYNQQAYAQRLAEEETERAAEEAAEAQVNEEAEEAQIRETAGEAVEEESEQPILNGPVIAFLVIAVCGDVVLIGQKIKERKSD